MRNSCYFVQGRQFSEIECVNCLAFFEGRALLQSWSDYLDGLRSEILNDFATTTQPHQALDLQSAEKSESSLEIFSQPVRPSRQHVENKLLKFCG